MFLSDFFTIMYFVIASIAVYFLLTCLLDKKFCKNSEDMFVLPTQGFISPLSMLMESRYKVFFQSFISPRNPYVFIIIGVLIGYLVISIRKHLSKNEKDNLENKDNQDNRENQNTLTQEEL